MELPVAAGVCVVLGEVVALGSLPPFSLALLGFACGFLLSSSALIVNDIFDREVDRVNAPHRPLPAGTISTQEALGISLIVTLSGLAASWGISPTALIFSLFIWFNGFLYNWKFKQYGLAGNLMVSLSVAATLILGGLAVNRPFDPLVWFLALGAFLVDLAEEIAGDAMDVSGDRLRGSNSLALHIGREPALRISAGIFALVLILTTLPLIFGWLGMQYLLAILVMDSALVYFTVKLLRSRNSQDGTAAMRGIYLGILAGMLIYLTAMMII